MDRNALEEEQKALLSDKAGEMEYLQFLQERTEQIKVGQFQVVHFKGLFCTRERYHGFFTFLGI